MSNDPAFMCQSVEDFIASMSAVSTNSTSISQSSQSTSAVSVESDSVYASINQQDVDTSTVSNTLTWSAPSINDMVSISSREDLPSQNAVNSLQNQLNENVSLANEARVTNIPFSPYELKTLDRMATASRVTTGTGQINWPDVALAWYNLWDSQTNSEPTERVLSRNQHSLESKYNALRTSAKYLASGIQMKSVAESSPLASEEPHMNTDQEDLTPKP